MRRQFDLPVLSAGATTDLSKDLAVNLPADDDTNAAASPKQLLLVLWAYRKYTIIIAVALLALSILVIKFLPKSYQATATLIVNTDIHDPLAGKDPTGLQGGYIPTEMQLMESAEVLLPVIDQLKLTTIPYYTAGYRPVNGAEGNEASLRDWVRQKLQKDLEITQGSQGSLLINISATARAGRLMW